MRTGHSYTPGSFIEFVESSLGYDARSRVASQKLVGDIKLTDAFSFDDADRLVGWQRTTEDGTVSAGYSYDAAGNMTTATHGSSETDYSYDADDRLIKAVEGSKVTTYTNDVYGRRTSATASGETTTYAYDPLGQLTSVDSPKAHVSYAYGPSGMLELKTVVSDGATSTVRSVWDGQQLVAEQDGDGTTYTYVWGPDRLPLALKVARPDGSSSTYSYHLDALGDVIGLTDDTAQTTVATYSYDPWGALTAIGGTDPALAARQPLRYRSYCYDPATGLYRLPARCYDPATARFLTPDPACPSASDPLGLNRYSYCEDSPIAASDPSGATMDANGSGRLESIDCIVESSERATNRRMKAYWHKAIEDYYKAIAAAKKARALAIRTRLRNDPYFGLSNAAIEAEAAQKAIAVCGLVVFAASICVITMGAATPGIVAAMSAYGGYILGGATVIAAVHRHAVDSARYNDTDMTRDVIYGGLTIGAGRFSNWVGGSRGYLSMQGVDESQAARVGTGVGFGWGVPSLANDIGTGQFRK